MRLLFITMSCLLFSNGLISQSAPDDPKTVIEDFFKAFHARDTSGMGQLMAVGMQLQTMKPSGASEFTLVDQSRERFLSGMHQLPDTLQIEERIKSYEVIMDGPIAQVWTPYEFYVNGHFSHCGVNAFQLGKVMGKWQIIYLVDTRRKSDCP